ncbi:pantoate--beta-alanine ligase [Gillisia sp. Q332]|uniref:pantoate--beta-alanine ligase n=1 Tax=Gillisia xinjiangensis TaxID=3384765 RepID=UPI00391CD620
MQIFREKALLQREISRLKLNKNTIGFVPTMGALHQGHLSLVRQAAEVCDAVVVSIFINPTQFDNLKDLENYPRTLDSDIALLEDLHLDLLLFTPNAAELYGEEIQAMHFDFGGIEHEMEGKYRTGHFNGVGTVVKRLFEIVVPNKAFFGEKDFQQLQIIRKLNEKENLGVDVIGCPIDREDTGLARSSRNDRLSANLRKEAAFIYQILLKVKEKFGIENADEIKLWVENEFENHAELNLEYFEIADSKTLRSENNNDQKSTFRAFIAAYAGDVRLIDNIALNY